MCKKKKKKAVSYVLIHFPQYPVQFRSSVKHNRGDKLTVFVVLVVKTNYSPEGKKVTQLSIFHQRKI